MNYELGWRQGHSENRNTRCQPDGEFFCRSKMRLRERSEDQEVRNSSSIYCLNSARLGFERLCMSQNMCTVR